MKIQIEAELSNYIESLHYDRNSIQELLLMAAKQGLKDTDAYNAWMKDYSARARNTRSQKRRWNVSLSFLPSAMQRLTGCLISRPPR